MPKRINTPVRVRSVRAGRDVEKFLEDASTGELAAYSRSFSAGNKAVIRSFNVRSGEERGQPHPTVEEFFRRLARFSGVTEIGPEQTRDRLLTSYREVIGPRGGKGSLVAATLWDNLPAARKSTEAVFTPPTRPRSSSDPGTPRGSRTPRTPRATTRGGGRGPRGRGRGPRAKGSTRKNIPVKGFAVVQSAEKPWVKETNYRRWLGKLRQHTAKVRKHGEEDHPMNLCVDSKLCKGDLGIPRKLMPQFNSPRDIRSFTRFIDRKYGIKAVRATRRAGQLRPSQEEIHRERVEDVKDDIKAKKLNPNVPLIVSEDGYVIDGHHRWAAYKSHQPQKRLPVLLVKDSARDVLSMAATWGARHHQF